MALFLIGAAASIPADAQEGVTGAAVPGAAAAPEAAEPAAAPVPPYGYIFTRGDRHLLALARVHEAGWRTGVADAGAILQVVMNRRHSGESFEESLARTMPHFYAGVLAARGFVVDPDEITPRRWVVELPNGPIRRNPAHWFFDYPAAHHNDDWSDVNEDAHGYMTGRIALPFAEPVIRWFGRETDGEQLADALAAGWCEAEGSAETTLNAFLVRCADMGLRGSHDE